MKTKHVRVEKYNPCWKTAFQQIESELLDALGAYAARIEHVGSTSVPGLAAKPIIDIDVVISDIALLPAVITALESIGYTYEGDLGIPERYAFKYTDKPHLMQHHLYVCPGSSPELHRHITFREYLRTHPEAAAEYGRIKTKAAQLYPDSIEQYIAHKSPFIEKIYAQLGLQSAAQTL